MTVKFHFPQQDTSVSASAVLKQTEISVLPARIQETCKQMKNSLRLEDSLLGEPPDTTPHRPCHKVLSGNTK